MVIMLWFRSQGKEKEAESLLKDSIHFGPHFADAYSSLASLYADQVNHQPFPSLMKLKTALLNFLCSFVQL